MLRGWKLAMGRRKKADRQRRWSENLNYPGRRQFTLTLAGDPARELVLDVDMTHISLVKRQDGRTFEAAVGQCGRGGRGEPAIESSLDLCEIQLFCEIFSPTRKCVRNQDLVRPNYESGDTEAAPIFN